MNSILTRRYVLFFLAVLILTFAVWRLGTTRYLEYQWSSNAEAAAKLSESGDYAEAAARLEVALNALRELEDVGPRREETMLRLVAAYEAQGRYHETEPLYLALLQKRAKLFGSESIPVAQTLYDLGEIYRLQGRNDAALGLYNQAFDTWQAAEPGGHPDMVPTLEGLAAIHHANEDYDQATQFYDWALGLRRRELGTDHPDVAPLEKRYADALEKAGKTDLAKGLREHAERISQQ